MKDTKAKCNSCGHIQDARKGFECEKCKGETFTEKEEKDLTFMWGLVIGILIGVGLSMLV